MINGADANLFLEIPDQFQQSLFGFTSSLISEDQTAKRKQYCTNARGPDPSTQTDLTIYLRLLLKTREEFAASGDLITRSASLQLTSTAHRMEEKVRLQEPSDLRTS
jgi:hypothetical protein